MRKVAETATQMFISNDKCNVTGIVLAGSADFKEVLAQSDVFDPRLLAKVVKIVDVSYGGENGFNQAIELCAETLANVKFVPVTSRPRSLLARISSSLPVLSMQWCWKV